MICRLAERIVSMVLPPKPISWLVDRGDKPLRLSDFISVYKVN